MNEALAVRDLRLGTLSVSDFKKSGTNAIDAVYPAQNMNATTW